MRISKIAGLCLVGACLAVVLVLHAAPAEALKGCFCSKRFKADRICGEVPRLDDDEIGVQPPNMGYRILKRNEYVECTAEEVEPIQPPRCLPGQVLQGGACMALPQAPKEEEPAPSDREFGIAGSNTIGEKLMPTLIKAFGRSQGFATEGEACAGTTLSLRKGSWTLSIACSARGSHTGIPALAAGEADIAMLSRPIDADERDMMRRAGYPNMESARYETVLALDGLLIIVARQNRVRALSVDQIARVFAGEITDWGQLGGQPGRIRLYVRDENSGTRDTFEAMVMQPHGKRVSDLAARFQSSSELSDSVAADPLGIGFVGFAYQRAARTLPIAQACGLVHTPSVLAIKAEDYPLSRRLFLYTGRQHSVYSGQLLDYALSADAQAVIERAGYVDQTISSWSAEETRSRVAVYVAAPLHEPGLERDGRRLNDLRAAAERAERLSISFRFRSNSTRLDTKAWQDVLRLADYMKTAARNQKVLLLGFTDSNGSFAANLALSQARADEVRTSLLSSGAGLSPDLIGASGYSELMPIACNADEAGRAKNRRVEVWLIPR
ncbi:MAG: phosphate ABC transporter substrate-binding/OmpA family protein [Hyphomicrobiaceae bacterium]|nr:phosphate ABC transporter substrate-binding/OmpA family protein [Hyphomicrobiaceae bacterium]